MLAWLSRILSKKTAAGSKGLALKYAVTRTHSVTATTAPSGESPTEGETLQHYFLDITITPRTIEGQPLATWEPKLLRLASAALPPANGEENTDFGFVKGWEIWNGNTFAPPGEETVSGEQRLRLLVAATPGLGESYFAYYSESFGKLELKNAAPSPIRTSAAPVAVVPPPNPARAPSDLSVRRIENPNPVRQSSSVRLKTSIPDPVELAENKPAAPAPAPAGSRRPGPIAGPIVKKSAAAPVSPFAPPAQRRPSEIQPITLPPLQRQPTPAPAPAVRQSESRPAPAPAPTPIPAPTPAPAPAPIPAPAIAPAPILPPLQFNSLPTQVSSNKPAPAPDLNPPAPAALPSLSLGLKTADQLRSAPTPNLVLPPNLAPSAPKLDFDPPPLQGASGTSSPELPGYENSPAPATDEQRKAQLSLRISRLSSLAKANQPQLDFAADTAIFGLPPAAIAAATASLPLSAPPLPPTAPPPPPPPPLAPVEPPVFYYLLDQGAPTGPFAAADLRARLQQGTIQPTDYIWNDSLPNWLLITEVLKP